MRDLLHVLGISTFHAARAEGFWMLRAKQTRTVLRTLFVFQVAILDNPAPESGIDSTKSKGKAYHSQKRLGRYCKVHFESQRPPKTGSRNKNMPFCTSLFCLSM